MAVLIIGVYLKPLYHLPSYLILGEHPLDRYPYDLGRFIGKHRLKVFLLQTARIPGIRLVHLILHLPSGNPYILCVYDDDAVPVGPLACQIEYRSVGHLGEHDEKGWLLAWKADVSGDLNGEMRWWFPELPPVPEGAYAGGKVGYYLARWELWKGDELILAGESAGKTVIPDGEDGIWDGHGLVTETNGEMRSLRGRKIYETGTVLMPADPDVRSTGSGMFVIY